MEVRALIKHLKDGEYIRKNHFDLAKNIVNIYNESSDIDSQLSQELVLRALDRYEDFSDSQIIIDNLVKELRLYPAMSYNFVVTRKFLI